TARSCTRSRRRTASGSCARPTADRASASRRRSPTSSRSSRPTSAPTRTAAGQSKVFVRNSPDGLTWTTPAVPVDTAAIGHQFFPDITTGGGTLSVVFQDSRTDPAYSPGLPPGDTAAGTNSGNVVQATVA